MSGLWKLAVRGEFSAAHALRHYQGKCENLHGHNFETEVMISGTRLDPETGMLVDYKILKEILKDITKDFDHCELNRIAPFEEINPSSENMAKIIYERFERLLAVLLNAKEAGLKVCSVTVWEKNGQCAAYCKE